MCVYLLGKADMAFDVNTLKQFICDVMATHLDESSCVECYENVERFAELTLQGQNAVLLMPHVQAHLEQCIDCRQEFVALLDALHGTTRIQQ